MMERVGVSVSRADDPSEIDRFVLKRRLGEGGMGVVYEAYDRELEMPVALKTLRAMEPQALLLFKNEFRALQDLKHPNLVGLGELIETSGMWLFTMELVHGVDLLRYVRPDDPFDYDNGPTENLVTSTKLGPPERSEAVGVMPVTGDRPAATFDEPRLRHTLGQLAQAIHTLHQADKIHRDIKPSNILVADDGRAVVLDFGVVASASDDNQLFVGTPSYMAPEQAAAQRVGPPADWYAVGVLLYQALTGQLPINGRPDVVVDMKQRLEPPPPHTLVPSVPEDLDQLCVELLRIDPARRPTGQQIVERLGRQVTREQRWVASSTSVFVGRRGELDALRAAFRDSANSATIVAVEGESGVGKTALVRRFVQSVGMESNALVLSGRCYERESVPYKAIDGIVDAMTTHLLSLPADDVRALLNKHAVLLLPLFPVLNRLERLDPDGSSKDAPAATQDPAELRTRAFAALREIWAALAQRRPLVLVIDDLQWSDPDSLALLREALRPDVAPRLLLVATVRDGESSARASATVAELPTVPGGLRRIALGRLSAEEARRFAIKLSSGVDELARIDPSSVAATSQGHPLFVIELMRHALAFGHTRGVKLEQAIWSRVSHLDERLRQRVELLATAGGPLSVATAAAAAGVGVGELLEDLSTLRYEHLVRTSGVRKSDSVEIFNAPIRDAVLGHLEAGELKAWHRRIARALEAQQPIDYEAVVEHWRLADEPARAASFVVPAAAQAAAALAFERAARLYRLALDLVERKGQEAVDLYTALGDALANCGRSGNAGNAYLAAIVAGATNALDLRRRAAEQFLRGGYIDEGMKTVDLILREVGLRSPSSPTWALASLLFRRAQVRLRGLRFRARPAGAPDDVNCLRADICSSIGVAIGFIDTMRGADFLSRSVLYALRSGDLNRIGRALAAEAAYSAGAGGGRTRARTERLLAAAGEVVKQTGPGYNQIIIDSTRAMAAYSYGQWRESLDLLREAERRFKEQTIGCWYEISTAMQYQVGCLFYLGWIDEITARIDSTMREAADKGDRYTAASVRTGNSIVRWLAVENVEGARADMRKALEEWSQDGFHYQNYFVEVVSLSLIEMYAGDYRAARERILRLWPQIQQSKLLFCQVPFIECSMLRARTILASIAAGLEPVAHVAEPLKLAATVEKEKMGWGNGLAALVRAGAMALKGQPDAAAKSLADAIEILDRQQMGLHAASARRMRGLVIGGDEGRALIEQADAWMKSRGIRNPARMAQLFVPGFVK
jgi:serine/threonine protein kinase/tetratricopeptide (TPR) repeat protein